MPPAHAGAVEAPRSYAGGLRCAAPRSVWSLPGIVILCAIIGLAEAVTAGWERSVEPINDDMWADADALLENFRDGCHPPS